MLQKLLFLSILFFTLGACKSYQMGKEYHRMELIPREYDIVGTIRVDNKDGKKSLTYDGLLKKAREKYGENVDIINVKIDKASKLGGKGDSFTIINAYAIRYK